MLAMRKKQFLAMLALFGFVMVSIFSLAVGILVHSIQKNKSSLPAPEPEYIYVYVPETGSDESDTALPDTGSVGWILKEHHGQIGIFQKDGTLIQVLDTYIKTLPKADRGMLGEGIYADTEEELRDLIEDYSD